MLFRSNDTATTEIYTIAYTLSLHDALPIYIFRGNSLKGGLLTIILDQAEVEALWETIDADPTTSITVDLETRTVSYGSKSLPFAIDDYTRWRLMEGLDDIGLTLKQTDSIDSFEKNRAAYKPKTLPVRS